MGNILQAMKDALGSLGRFTGEEGSTEDDFRIMDNLIVAIEEMEKAESVAQVTSFGCQPLCQFDVHEWGTPLYLHPAPAIPEGWLRAIDEEMVVCCIGVADAADDYESARKKLGELIQWHVDVALNKAVNGGLTMVPIEPTKEMSDAFWSAYIPENKTAGAQASSFEDWWDFIHMYKAMLAAAPEYKP